MQTCIVKGFVDVPGTKYYYYHGMLRPCNIQPEIECFDKIDTTLSKWKLIYDDRPATADSWKRDFDYLLFPPSTQSDICYFKFPDHKRRYYFYEIYYVFVPRYDPDWWTVHWDHGIDCCMNGELGVTHYYYKANYDFLEYGEPGYQYCIYLDPVTLGTHVRIWATTDGNLPDYYPVPINEIKW